MAPRTIPLAEKIDKYVVNGALDECWPYTGTTDRFGYGQMTLGKKYSFQAHRVAFELANGPIPDGLIVRHKCDNPPCCNPAHLELGTHYDNAQDKVSRGRWRGGTPKVERCQRGHDDWYTQKSDGRRRCRICRNAAAVARSKAKKDIPDQPYSY